MSGRVQLWSCGGGRQSAGIAALIVLGRLPQPDHVAMVALEWERRETFRYVNAYIRPAMQSLGVPFTFVPRKKYATKGFWGGEDDATLLLPAYSDQSGSPSKLSEFCSGKWKLDAMARWAAEQPGWKERGVDNWIGISWDERHRRRGPRKKWLQTVYPLLDMMPKCMPVSACLEAVADLGWPEPPRSRCSHCLAGETLVVTRDGIRPIKTLAGTSPELMVPTVGRVGGLSEIGGFRAAPVKSFGTQMLWEVRLRRCRHEVVIRATAEHRWVLTAPSCRNAVPEWRTTAQLKSGDRLKTLRSQPVTKGDPLPLAVMQGFAFGDGTVAAGNRPGSLTIHKGKDEELLPLFAVCSPRPSKTDKGRDCWVVYGLPRSWKSLPDIRESRAFLLGWLSGWFAADGTVGKRGHPRLYAADRKPIEFARDVCAVLGIRTSSIISRMRKGIGHVWAPLHEIGLSARDVTESFFRLAHHRKWFVGRKGKTRDDQWVVHSVTPTDREEEVFCAEVEGVGAFGLVGDLMTGNCPNQADREWAELTPEEWQAACDLDDEIRRTDPHAYLHRSLTPLRLVTLKPEDDAPGLFGGCSSGTCY